MAFPVYSARLYAGTLTPINTKVLMGTVGMGHRVIVRTIAVLQVSGAASFTDFYLNAGGPFLYRVLPPTGDTAIVNGVHLVLHEGESLYGYARTNTSQVSLFGYVLEGTGAPGFPSSLPA